MISLQAKTLLLSLKELPQLDRANKVLEKITSTDKRKEDTQLAQLITINILTTVLTLGRGTRIQTSSATLRNYLERSK
jgi:hypothetical protein